MRFMVMHKVDAKMEAGEPPTRELVQQMGKFIGGHAKTGVCVDGAGLHRSAARVRVRFADGKPAVRRGPYAGEHELLAAFALISTTGVEAAIEHAIALGQAAGGREIEVGPVVEGWDLNGQARPADAPHRFLLLVKSDAALEAGGALPEAVGSLLERWQQSGLLQSRQTLKPSKSAARGKLVDGKRAWVDGPFAESKELIAGFAILELPSLAATKQLADDYVAILGDHFEVDIRELAT